MAASVLICLLSVLPLSTALKRSLLEEHFLCSLDKQDVQYYFGTTSTESVPQFQLIWPAWLSEDLPGGHRQCSIEAQGERYVLGVGRVSSPLLCSSWVDGVLNTSVGTGPSICCDRPTALQPNLARAALNLCDGVLQGLVLTRGKRLYIQPVSHKHRHLAVSADGSLLVPHLAFHRHLTVAPSPDHSHAGARLLRRSTVSSEVTHLELLVVVGPDVQQVHGPDTERYILTNLNIASELLRDASLGANLRVHLIRTIVLAEQETEIQISKNITSSLVSVCEWGRKVNPLNDTDPLHTDLLLYITRFDLELPDGNKQVRGVAQLGGVCSSQWSCVITEDTGFDLGITIAHEIGHSFGINHDGTGNACSNSGYMMASDGGYNSVDLTWSQCSRDQLQSFLSAGRADCVKDLPVLRGSLQDWKPGLYYGVDDQCRIAFGNTARACSFTNADIDVCRVLSCHTLPGDQSSCTRLLVPLLDGTECGPNQWCLKGRCVSPSQLSSSMVVHGAWSSWTEFSPCSRTCGGGVSSRRRHCNNPRPAFGGNDCEGEDTEAELCNKRPCPGTQLDFMEEQCSMTDPHPLYLSPSSASIYHWLPAVGLVTGDLQCKLMCRSQGEDFMVSRGPQFVDGTRCEPSSPAPPGSVAACLGGRCQLFGCDGLLNSRKVRDVCGVCGGDGSSCSPVSDSYIEGQAKEYLTFLTVPMNATQVCVVNTRPLFTHLAVLVQGRYVVAGMGSIALNTTYPSPLEDDRLMYHLYLTPDLLPHKEELMLSGPLSAETHIQVYQKYGKEYGEVTSPNISYSFYIPGGVANKSIKATPKGKWVALITPCSVTCGSGIQESSSVCVDEDTRERLAEDFCEATSRPGLFQATCHFPVCEPYWEMGGFGPCSASCGMGEMVRQVRCVQRQRAEILQRPISDCPQDSAPRPVKVCNPQPCPARWRVADLGECSAVCGPGEARRTVSCIQTEQGVDSKVDDSLCPQSDRPPDTLPCVVDVCPIGWETRAEVNQKHKVATEKLPRSRTDPVYVWSPVIGQCSKSCGRGNLQVWYTCVDHQSRLAVLEDHCDRLSRPQTHTEHCNPAPCPATWRYKQGVCSMTCGGGMARRVLYCARDTELGVEFAKESDCRSMPRPAEMVPCNTNTCPPRWRVHEPGPCSSSCGLGVARRRVSCVEFLQGSDSDVSDERCRPAERPPSTVPCLVQVCTFSWVVKEWSQCSVSCGYGIQSRSVSCVGPTHPQPLSPLLCIHMPKPITIQGCSLGDCIPHPTTPQARHPKLFDRTTEQQNQQGHQEVTTQPYSPESRGPVVTLGTVELNSTVEQEPSPASYKPETPQFRTATFPLGPWEISSLSTTPAPTTKSAGTSLCGQLLLHESGTVDLRHVIERDCILLIGRPLDEVIHIKVDSSSLNCKNREFLAFYDRLTLLKKCERVSGFTLTSKTNVLLVRQGLLYPSNGVLLTYHSQKSTKKSHYADCDVQLFGSKGEIVNPTKRSGSGVQTCRVFINVPPSAQIEIRALSIEPVTQDVTAQPTFILIRDVKMMKTTVFRGNQLFLWRASGSMVEVEFHGGYLHHKGSFRAEYSIIEP